MRQPDGTAYSKCGWRLVFLYSCRAAHIALCDCVNIFIFTFLCGLVTQCCEMCNSELLHVHVDVNQQFSNSLTNCSTNSCDSGTVLLNVDCKFMTEVLILASCSWFLGLTTRSASSACVFNTSSSFEPFFFLSFQEFIEDLKWWYKTTPPNRAVWG